jgi:hypothetical protein
MVRRELEIVVLESLILNDDLPKNIKKEKNSGHLLRVQEIETNNLP